MSLVRVFLLKTCFLAKPMKSGLPWERTFGGIESSFRLILGRFEGEKEDDQAEMIYS
jgi:hypothetical protein